MPARLFHKSTRGRVRLMTWKSMARGQPQVTPPLLGSSLNGQVVGWVHDYSVESPATA